MPKIVDYYVCLISPWTYLGDQRLNAIAETHSVRINLKPMNLGKVFPETGGLPLAKRAPARQAYRLQELERWRRFRDRPLNIRPKYFPANEWPAAGMVIAAKAQGLDCGRLASALLRAVWAEDRDIADTGTLTAIADECGLDGAKLLEAAERPQTAEQWDAYSAEALAAGVFGAPAYVFGDQLFWGQDRLDFLERALAAS